MTHTGKYRLLIFSLVFAFVRLGAQLIPPIPSEVYVDCMESDAEEIVNDSIMAAHFAVIDSLRKDGFWIEPDFMPEPLNFDSVRGLLACSSCGEWESDSHTRLPYRVLVNRSGRVIDYRKLMGDCPPLEQAIETHICDLRFRPGKVYGVPQCIWVTIPFHLPLK